MNKVTHDSETLAEGKQVITACAFIHQVFDGTERVFLAKRADTKRFLPGVFELPGGHIDFGEDIIDGLKREILEEFGMKATIGDAFAAFTYTNKIKKSHSIEVVFFAEFVDPVVNIKINAEDHSRFEWFAETDIPKIVSANRRGDDPEIVAIKKGFSLLK